MSGKASRKNNFEVGHTESTPSQSSLVSAFCVVLLEKRPVKILASFLVDSIAREHLAFLALTPPEFFTFPGGGVQTPPEFFTFPGGGSWGVLIWGPPPGSKTRPPSLSFPSSLENTKYLSHPSLL